MIKMINEPHTSLKCSSTDFLGLALLTAAAALVDVKLVDDDVDEVVTVVEVEAAVEVAAV